ncbi:serine/threonine-protein kinase [Neorhodopirellula lusitana]|uniref:serine/threonine-protein kinase n=1 Tax=Neorhodopirellula lusitana TaxID=445327 RepID=UPI00384EB6EB
MNCPSAKGASAIQGEHDALLDADTIPPETLKHDEKSGGVDPACFKVVDDYELLGEIARGAMGVVYRARQVSLRRIVALKMMLGEQNADSTRRFLAEAEAAASLDHPGIVPVYDVGQHDGRLYFTMALVDGKSLADRLVAGPLDPKVAARVAEQVANAIGYAHRRRWVHRDIKPANILIDGEGNARVTDFGVCKSMVSASEMTAVGQIVGTPHYMAPEQAGYKSQPGGVRELIVGSIAHDPVDASVGPTADIYSIGAVLYATLTGRPPFQAANPLDVVAQVLTQDPVPVRILNPSVPGELDVITMKCLAKERVDRYQSAESLANDLQRFLEGVPILAKPPGWARRLRHAINQHLVVATVSGTAALALVCLASLLLLFWLQARWQLNQMQDQLAYERASTATHLLALRQKRSDSQETSSGKQDAAIGRAGGTGDVPRTAGKEELGGDVLSKEAGKSVAEFELARLSDSVERLASNGHDETAVQIAIAAIRHAQQNQLEPSGRVVALLQTLDPEQADLDELLELAEGSIRKPLSDFELTLYGIHQREEPRTDETY